MLVRARIRRMVTHAQGTTRILGFDGLRAIAFVLVFFSHKISFAQVDPYGEVGVWLFFALSGFLITRILAGEREEIERGRSTALDSLRRFYIRRTARIFPPYYALLAIISVVWLLVPIDFFWRTEKLAYATFTTNFLVGSRGLWVGNFGHFWTLAIEEQYYLFFAPLVLFMPRKYTMTLCLALILSAVVTKTVLVAQGVSSITAGVNSIVNFGLLSVGGVAGLNAHRRLPPWSTGGVAQFAVLATFVALAPLFGSDAKWLIFAKLSVVLPAFLLIQIAQGQRSWFVGLLHWSPLRDLGRISYGAYLLHNLIYLAPLISGIPPKTMIFGPSWVLFTVAEFVSTIAIATLSWRYMEKPIIAWTARVAGREGAEVDAVRSPSLQS
jgi:peptidoglycan/LPS O-acetylase OafA/YrhL